MNKLGVIQTIIWTIGMMFMSGAMHWVGLFGSPRRTSYTTYGDHAYSVRLGSIFDVISGWGTLLIIALFFKCMQYLI